jgi:hypothetical protein
MAGPDIQEETGLGCRFADEFKSGGSFQRPITEARVREIIDAVLAERDRKAAELTEGLRTEATAMIKTVA